MTNGTVLRSPTCRDRHVTAWWVCTLLLLIGAFPADAQHLVSPSSAAAPGVGTGAAVPPDRVKPCPASEDAPIEIQQKLNSHLDRREYQDAIDLILKEQKERDCPVWHCYLATWRCSIARELAEDRKPEAQSKWRETLVDAKRCIEKGAVAPGGGAYSSARELRKCKADAEQTVLPSAQPAYQRDVKLSVVFGITGLAMLLGGAISYAVLERQPYMLDRSACMPSSGFKDEPCGTHLYGLTWPLISVGSAAVGVAVVFGAKPVFSPKRYLPKNPQTPEDAAARGGNR